MHYVALGGLNNDNRQMPYYRCTSDSGSLFFMSQRVAVDYVLGQRLYGKCIYGS